MEAPRFFRLLVGLILIVFAAGMLFGNLGMSQLSQLVHKMFWPMIVIVIGIYLFFSYPQNTKDETPKAATPVVVETAPAGPRVRESKIAGELHMTPAGPVQKVLADLTFGKCVVDLTPTIWENGVGTADIQGLIGEVDLLVPAGLGVNYDIHCFIGAIRAEGRNSDGVGNHFNLKTPAAEGASTIDLRIGLAIGEIKVYRV